MAPTKRTVDANDETKEIADPKRPRISLDQDKKSAILLYILEATMELYSLFNLIPQLNNITIGHQMASIVQGAHNIMRRIANTNVADHPSLRLNASITFCGNTYSHTYREITEKMKAVATRHNLMYTASDRLRNDHWYGIANPIFNIISAFKLLIRLGVGKMPVAKAGDLTSSIDVAQYGIMPAHHVLRGFPVHSSALISQKIIAHRKRN